MQLKCRLKMSSKKLCKQVKHLISKGCKKKKKMQFSPPFLFTAASLTFSDGSWWMTGGMEKLQPNISSNLPIQPQPSLKTIFFDKQSGHTIPGRSLKWPQAGHCTVEVGNSFVSAGGFHQKVPT